MLHFSHSDFIKAIKQDLGPVFGECGLWVLTNMANRYKDKGKTEKRRKAQVSIDMVKSFLESGLDYLSKENKYNFMNKFCPKKMKD